jgi:hypothetical protein
MNPEYHLALGRMHAATGDQTRAGVEYAKAGATIDKSLIIQP